MKRPAWTQGLGARIAAIAVATAAAGVGIVAFGVVIVGADTFAKLMVEHGNSAAAAHEMFDASVTAVLGIAVVVALGAAVSLAVVFGRRIGKPLAEIGAAARRVAAGDYETRVPREGPEEIAGLADSFNQMAASLQEGEQLRRDFIANAAHELRTPMTTLMGYIEGLRDGVVKADRATYESLLEEVDRLSRLAASLETLAEGDTHTIPARIAEIDLVAFMRAAVELARPGLDKAGISIDLRLPATLPARAEPDRLAQVLGNLLQNAMRYTAPQGRVTLSAARRSSDVLVTIANTGDGIPEADLPHVFERFYRVDKSRSRAHGGAGIGLAIVRQLVEGVGGTVGVESKAGLTRFWFSLPV